MSLIVYTYLIFMYHRRLSLERAVKIDGLSDQSLEFSGEAYQQPVLTENAAVPICEVDGHALTEDHHIGTAGRAAMNLAEYVLQGEGCEQGCSGL